MHDVHNIGNLEDKLFNLWTRMQFMSGKKIVFYRKFLERLGDG